MPPPGVPSDSQALPPGVTQAQIERHSRRVSATAEASADPLPGPLADAFPTVDIIVHGIHVRPVVAADFPILRKLQSPRYRQMLEAAKPPELRTPTEFTDEDGWEMIYQFTNPALAVELALAQGRAHFRRIAHEQIGMRMNPFIAAQVAEAVGEQMKRSYETALRYKAAGEAKEVFTAPPPASTTASAGGSITSAD